MNENGVFLAYDLGTTATKSVLVSNEGRFLQSEVEQYETYYPMKGYAEHNPEDWMRTITATTRRLLDDSGIGSEKIKAVTFSAQMQGLLPINQDGTPLTNCMIWLDARGAEFVKKIWPWPRIMGYNPYRLFRKFLKITGGAPGLSGKDQIPKIIWLKEKRPDIYEQTYKFLDVKDYVIYKLTGEIAISSDCAYVWWLMDSRKDKSGKPRNKWSETLCKIYGIDKKKLPEIRRPSDLISDKILPNVAADLGLSEKTPVICGAGDMTTAAVSSGAVMDGELHCQIGTSGWVAGHVSKRKVDIFHYTGCAGSAFPDDYYLVTGHQEIAGAALEWVKNKVLYSTDELRRRQSKEIYEIFDDLVQDCEPGARGDGGTNLMFIPWFAGERSPLDDENVRGGLINLSLDHDRRHILRAVFEGVAFNTRWALETVENLYHPVTSLAIIGGGAKSAVWCQILADVLNRTIHRVEEPQEAGAIGAALLAKMALREIKEIAEIKQYCHYKDTFSPNPEYRELYDGLFVEFKNLYKKTRSWFARMNRH
ncbi:MAG: FGGY-family carbohydrate kinase [Candidatus Heimdallarchaeota archaeon]